MTDEINQKDISVTNGDNIGRDKKTTVYNISGPLSPMAKLSIAFIEESKTNTMYNEVLPELGHYMSQVDLDKIVGLEEKLKAANKHDLLSDAERQKEIIAKRLHKHSTSKSAQKIYTQILGMLLNRFRTYVTPLINAGASDSDISETLLTEVIEPTIGILDENVLDIFYDDIWGMIYYLTGNCHIRWH